MATLRSTDQEQLQKLLLGQLPTAEVERLATEYADDSRLAQLAESLAGNVDALLHLLHNHETAVVDPEGERLVERLIQRLKPALPLSPRDDTAAMNRADVSTEPSSPVATGQPQKLPQQLEYYRPIKVLGQGGMGTVYLAEDTRLGREVAIKTLRPELAINPQAKERFLREARTAAKLEHDNVIPIYSVGEADGTPFLAMPFLKGEPLDSLIRRTAGPLPVATAVRLAREVASGLAAAHARGLIHRDIKPANIWLEAPTGRVKILDFGLAKAADAASEADSETNLTASGAIVGTPAYMAPEQASGHPVDGRADLFSLGCVMYELLTGKRAFSGPNTMSILMSLANHTPPAPDKLSAQCPAALSQLVMQLLEKDPAKRPASAEVVIQALAELDCESVQASWVASSPGLSPNTTAVRGLMPSGSPILVGSDLSRPSDSLLTMPATAILPVRKRAIPMQWVALALVGTLLMLLAGVVYRIQTDKGTLIVTIEEDPAVQAILEKDGLVIRDKNSDRTWTIKATETKPLPSGKYRVDEKPNLQLLVTDDDGAEVKTDEFTLKRKGERRVRVVLEQPPSLAGQTSNKNKPVAGTGWHGWPVGAPKPAIAPFDAAQAKKHQEEWAAYLKVPVEYTNSIGMKFRLIPPSEFMMGSSPDEVEAALKEVGEDHGWRACIQSEAQQHKVILTQPVYVGVTEVTQTQYEQVMGTNPSHFSANGAGKHAVAGLDTSIHPVEQLTWNDAAEFCARLSQKEMLNPFYLRRESTVTPLEGNGYRLPTEAEWEATCRAGTTTRFWSGDQDNDLLQAGWFGSNSGGRTHAVGELRSNPFGLSDMSGNVWEWVQDNWDPAFYGRFMGNAAVNPSQSFSAGYQRVLRGGVWLYGSFACRSSHRFASDPRHRHYNIGFRVALPVDAVRQASNVTGPTMSKSAATSPDRRAAEYVLSIGGRIKIKNAEQQELDLNRNNDGITRLPSGAFELTLVSLANNAKVTDASLAVFKGCQHLNDLSLYEAREVTDVGLAHFKDSKNWTQLDLFMTQVTDAGLQYFQGCENLTLLRLAATQVSDAGLTHFQDCKKLTALDLNGARQVTDVGLANFRNCEGLAHLLLSRTQVSDAGLANFKKLPELLHLHLMGTNVTDAALSNFKDCEKLEVLDVADTRIGDAGMAHLKGLKNLAVLVIHFTNLSDASLEQIAGYRLLTFLNVKNTKVTEAGVKKLSAALPGCKIEWDGGVIGPTVSLDRRAAEWVLSIGGTVTIDDGQQRSVSAMIELSAGSWKLHGINLYGKPLTPADLKKLNGLTSLWSLDLGDAKLGDACVKELAGLTSLRWLAIPGSQMTDAGLKELAVLVNIEQVALQNTLVTDAGLVHLTAWKNLWSLGLNNTQISDAGVRHLKDCKNLKALHLHNTLLSDAGLAFLADCPKLEALKVNNTNVTEAGVKKLSAALPGCKIEWDGGVIEPTVSPDRKAAEYVLSIGGSISINENGQQLSPPAVGNLPPSAFELTGVGLAENAKMTDAGLALFEHCKNLTSLDLHTTAVSDVGLAYFKNSKNLTVLNLGWCPRVSDAGLAYFKDCKHLTTLYLQGQGDQITDAGLAYFGDCKQLTTLFLQAIRISDAGLAHFRDCKQLTSLTLQSTDVTEAGLGLFQHCSKLTTLALHGTPVTDTGLAHFRNCKDLVTLELDSPQVSDAGLAHFKNCSNLAYVALRCVQMSDVGLAHFQNCKNLVALNLVGTQVSDVGLALFQDSRRFTDLNLDATRVTDVGLEQLARNPNLTRLTIRKAKVTEAGVKKLSAALPGCKIEWDGGVIEPTVSANR